MLLTHHTYEPCFNLPSSSVNTLIHDTVSMYSSICPSLFLLCSMQTCVACPVFRPLSPPRCLLSTTYHYYDASLSNIALSVAVMTHLTCTLSSYIYVFITTSLRDPWGQIMCISEPSFNSIAHISLRPSSLQSTTLKPIMVLELKHSSLHAHSLAWFTFFSLFCCVSRHYHHSTSHDSVDAHHTASQCYYSSALLSISFDGLYSPHSSTPLYV